VDASITQLFYTANMYHDLLYLLGFTEKAGNFEINNNGQGGLGNDQVILNTQDGSGTNNANFATPPDGQLPRMRMYVWDKSTPNRDCSFEAGVVIHEYTVSHLLYVHGE
jgi:extracellular elastinolytic metalloproteinase